MWKRFKPGWVCLFLILVAGTVSGQFRTVPFPVPDRSPTLGTPIVLPFSPADGEVRFQFVVFPDRLPQGCWPGKLFAIEGFSLIAAGTGRIEVDEATIAVAQIPCKQPFSWDFVDNLKEVTYVQFGTSLSLPANKSSYQKGEKISFPLPVHHDYKSRTKLVIELKLRGIKKGFSVLAATRLLKSRYARGPGSYEARKATHEGAGPKITVDFLSALPSITSVGSANPGTTLGLYFNAPLNMNDAYQAGCAFSTSPGLDVGDYEIPLAPDPLFFTSWYLRNILFMGFDGSLSASGFASGSIKIPDEPALLGVSFAVAFVTLDQQSQISAVSLEHWVTIGAGGP
jgi:hypothetical protein